MISFPEDRIKASLNFIHSKIRYRVSIGIILGSGLGNFVNEIENACSVSTKDIPYYPHSTIAGHAGYLHFGRIGNISIVAFQGRTHFYETGSLPDTLYPIVIAQRLGVNVLIVTNAAGGINPKFTPGDLMLITDHINFTFRTVYLTLPGRGYSPDYYDPELIHIARSAAIKEHIYLHEGVYCGISGPSYETVAEVKMLRILGADAVGMSTVNEVVCANHLGIRILGISCISNLSSGLGPSKLSHEEVTSAVASVQISFNRLIRIFVNSLAVSR